MKKLLSLLLLTLTVSCFNASAKTDRLYAEFGTPVTNASYGDAEKAQTAGFTGDDASNVFSWSASSYNYMNIFTGLNEKNISNYKTLHIEVTGECYYRIFIICSNPSENAFVGRYKGSVDINLDDITLTGGTKSEITTIRISGDQTASGYIVINDKDIYLEGTYEYLEISKPVQYFTWLPYDPSVEFKQTGLSRNLDKSLGQNGIIYGPTSANAKTAYIDVEAFDYAKIELSETGTYGIRFLYGDATIATIETKIGQYYYKQSLTDINNIGNIKTKNVGSQSNITVHSINFCKDYKPGLDNSPWTLSKDIDATEVEYDRTFTTGRKCTICLPFALSASEVSEAGTFYELSGFENGQLSFTAVTETEAYVPYVFEPASTQPFANLTNKTIVASANNDVTEGEVTFKGSLSHISDLAATETGNNVYGYSASNGTFVKVGTGVSIDAFRAYLVIPSSSGMNSVRASFDEPIQTGIESIEKTQISSNAYNLNGQMVSRNAKGMVICNGKIVINK